MSNRFQFIVKIGIIGALVGVFAIYGMQKLSSFWAGPQITIQTPQDGTSVSESFLKVEGTMKNIAKLSLNGRKIFADKNGFFGEGLLLARGYNIIEIAGEDRFDRVIKEKREIVLK